MKRAVARAALDYIHPRLGRDTVIGIGTGSTANCFIDFLGEISAEVNATVASSDASAERLRGHGIQVLDLNDVEKVDVYVDGADESNAHLELIKGGGAALTREKIVAATAAEFVCICDESKLVEQLGRFPLPVEVIPMARSHVMRQLESMGGSPMHREGVVTDNGNIIVDVLNFTIDKPRDMEAAINAIPGVVTNGLFAARPADLLLLARPGGVETLKAPGGSR